jgi:putative hemolysin
MVGIITSTGEVTQIANPASVFCEQNSGTVEIITDLSG